MTTIQPEGDALRKAVKFIADGLQYEPKNTLRALIDAACLKFNLSPKDEAYLNNFYLKK